jgi:hypothetical protein
MSIKLRHYDRSLAPVARYKGDVSHLLSEHMTHQFDASTFLPPTVTPQRPSLMPTADGQIARILLTIPNYAIKEPVMADSYRSLLASLPSHTRLVVLVQEGAEQTFRAWLKEFALDGRSEVATFPDTLNISIWAEDGYVVAHDKPSGQTYFVEPYAFPRYADGLVADYVTNFTDLKNTQAPLYFQGGNTLIGNDFVFIGADYPAKSLQYVKSGVLNPPAGQSATDFIKGLYSKYLDPDRRIIYVGSKVPVPSETTQPVTINGEQWTEILYAGNDPKWHGPAVVPHRHVSDAGRKGRRR